METLRIPLIMPTTKLLHSVAINSIKKLSFSSILYSLLDRHMLSDHVSHMELLEELKIRLTEDPSFIPNSEIGISSVLQSLRMSLPLDYPKEHKEIESILLNKYIKVFRNTGESNGYYLWASLGYLLDESTIDKWISLSKLHPVCEWTGEVNVSSLTGFILNSPLRDKVLHKMGGDVLMQRLYDNVPSSNFRERRLTAITRLIRLAYVNNSWAVLSSWKWKSLFQNPLESLGFRDFRLFLEFVYYISNKEMMESHPRLMHFFQDNLKTALTNDLTFLLTITPLHVIHSHKEFLVSHHPLFSDFFSRLVQHVCEKSISQLYESSQKGSRSLKEANLILDPLFFLRQWVLCLYSSNTSSNSFEKLNYIISNLVQSTSDPSMPKHLEVANIGNRLIRTLSATELPILLDTVIHLPHEHFQKSWNSLIQVDNTSPFIQKRARTTSTYIELILETLSSPRLGNFVSGRGIGTLLSPKVTRWLREYNGSLGESIINESKKVLLSSASSSFSKHTLENILLSHELTNNESMIIKEVLPKLPTRKKFTSIRD